MRITEGMSDKEKKSVDTPRNSQDPKENREKRAKISKRATRREFGFKKKSLPG